MDRYITLIVNPNQRVFSVEQQLAYVADDTGTLRLCVDELIVEQSSVLGFERDIEVLLPNEKQRALYEFLTKAKNITITVLANVLQVTKEQAKDIITIGVRNKVLSTGWNSTYKLASKELRIRFEQKTRSWVPGEVAIPQADTMQEQLSRLQEQGVVASKQTKQRKQRKGGA